MKKSPNMKLKGARVEQGKTQKYMSNVLGHSTMQSYTLKENGKREFTLTEAKLIAEDLKLTPEEINEIFFKN